MEQSGTQWPILPMTFVEHNYAMLAFTWESRGTNKKIKAREQRCKHDLIKYSLAVIINSTVTT